MDKIISKSKYSRKETKKFLMFHMLHHTSTIYIMLAVLAVLIFITANNVVKGQSVVFSLVCLGLTMGIIPFLIVSKINEVVKQETPERIQSTDTIEVTKHKITRSSDLEPGKNVVGWDTIDNISENEAFIYIYNNDNTGLYIKKADIVEGTVEDFRKIAMSNLKKDKKGKIPYKRYGVIKKEYKALMKQEKKNKEAK